MKKLFTTLMLLVLLVVLGCEEAQKSSPELPPKRVHLMPTDQRWQNTYGDDDQTNLYSNIWTLIILTQDARTRLKALEEKAVMDGEVVYLENNFVPHDSNDPEGVDSILPIYPVDGYVITKRADPNEMTE